MKSSLQTSLSPVRALTVLAAVAWLLTPSGLGAEPASPSGQIVDAGPVVASRERQFEFTSKINQGAYRVMVSAPPLEPGKRYPVFYVLDGNWYFRAASDTATWGSGPFEPAIVVGIGYPTEEYAEVRRRRGIDMTVKEEKARYPQGSGGCDAFLRVIEEEIKPFIASRYPVDAARQMLFGKSLGGLTVLRAMLRSPGRFSTYIAVSPGIAQGDKAVLQDEAAFSARARAGELKLRLLITSASEEEYTGPDPARRAADVSQMITNARGLADRLGGLSPEKVIVQYAMFQDEGHASVSLASIARALTFALPGPAERK